LSPVSFDVGQVAGVGVGAALVGIGARMAGVGTAGSAILVADDLTVIGVADDPLLVVTERKPVSDLVLVF
jgi:hypothetical protein